MPDRDSHIHLWSEQPSIALRARSRVGHVKYCGLDRGAPPATPSACLSQSIIGLVTIQSGTALPGQIEAPRHRGLAADCLVMLCKIKSPGSAPTLPAQWQAQSLLEPEDPHKYTSKQPMMLGQVESEGPQPSRWWVTQADTPPRQARKGPGVAANERGMIRNPRIETAAAYTWGWNGCDSSPKVNPRALRRQIYATKCHCLQVYLLSPCTHVVSAGRAGGGCPGN